MLGLKLIHASKKGPLCPLAITRYLSVPLYLNNVPDIGQHFTHILKYIMNGLYRILFVHLTNVCLLGFHWQIIIFQVVFQHQAIHWTNEKYVLWRHMASLRYNGLIHAEGFSSYFYHINGLHYGRNMWLVDILPTSFLLNYSYVTWSLWRLKSPAFRFLFNGLFPLTIKTLPPPPPPPPPPPHTHTHTHTHTHLPLKIHR